MTNEYIYNGNIYRPTVEAGSVLLPVTEGCTHNSCRFCTMFKGVQFRMLPEEQIEYYMKQIVDEYGRDIKKIFLVGADPFALSADNLEKPVKIIKKYIPDIELITMYAAVRNVKTKTDAELVRIHEMGIDSLYVGIENALDDVLTYLNKGNTIGEAKEQMLRLQKAGISYNALIMVGAAGKGRGTESAKAMAEFCNETKPSLISATTFGVFPGTEIEADVKRGIYTPAGEKENLLEHKTLIENLDLPETIYWSMHGLNAVRLNGNLGKEKEKLLKLLSYAVDMIDEADFAKYKHRVAV